MTSAQFAGVTAADGSIALSSLVPVAGEEVDTAYSVEIQVLDNGGYTTDMDYMWNGTVVAGVAANAASFKWSASGIQNFAGTGSYTGTATLYAYLATDDASTAKVVSTTTMNSGAIVAGDTVFASDDFTANATYTFYYTLTDDAGNVFTSGTKNGKAMATSTPVLGFSSTGSWAAVPEPTSGLLMLLGMAGLALRRRRA